MTPMLPLLPLCEVDMDPLSAAVQSRGMVLLVLIALVALSVLSWVVIGSRLWALRQLREGTTLFRSEFGKFNDLKEAAAALTAKHRTLPHVRLLAAVLKELDALERSGPLREHDVDALERSLRRVAEPLVEELESGLALLGSVASAAPFIGLFGTVWGIMGAFGGLADNGSILQTVAPHIAQALVATAVGLLAAIPASLAYNGLGRTVRKLVTDLDGFGLELLNLARRQHLRQGDGKSAPSTPVPVAAAPAVQVRARAATALPVDEPPPTPEA
jgi:biopolymer transport protein TolQ